MKGSGVRIPASALEGTSADSLKSALEEIAPKLDPELEWIMTALSGLSQVKPSWSQAGSWLGLWRRG